MEQRAQLGVIGATIDSRRINAGKAPASNNSYIVINTDEPYTPQIVEILKRYGHWGRAMKPRYMILKGGSPAIHKLGDIGREQDDLIYVKSETPDHFIGNFVEGFGFTDVAFKKNDCRSLNPGEIEELNNSVIRLGGIRYRMRVDPEGYPIEEKSHE
ncbi:hypothetical protein [Cohnella cellulosilytica]